MHPIHAYLQLDDLDIHYVRAGNPDSRHKIVLLHGWPETWYSWRHVLAGLTSAGDFDIIAPDLRGLGDSGRPGHGYDKHTVAKDVLQVLSSVWPNEKVLVVGHDWGGVVAFDLTLQLQDDACGLAVLDVTIPVEPGSSPVDFSQNGRRWHHAFHLTPELPELLISGREREYYTWFYTHFADPESPPFEPDLIDEYMRNYGSPEGLAAGLSYYRQIAADRARYSALSRPALHLPVLAVGGATGAGRGAETGISLSTFADDVTVEVIDNCGHWVMEEQPFVVTELLLNFAQRCSPA